MMYPMNRRFYYPFGFIVVRQANGKSVNFGAILSKLRGMHNKPCYEEAIEAQIKIQ